MEPKIRFKGFEGEWKTPSIGDVFELRNGYTPSKIVKEFWEGGTIPWFRMEDIRMNGGFLKDSLQHITPLAVKGAGLFEKRSIILATTATIGVHAMLIADSLANQRFTNFKVRKSLSDEYIDEFIYYSFFKIDEWSKNNTNSGGLLSVNMPLLVKQGFLTPCKEEQQTIASYFRILDAKLHASTKKVESLKKLKSASLVAMFPQQGETTPKVRFKGFEGEWKRHTLYDVLKINSGKDYKHLESGNIPVYGTGGYMLSVNDSLSNLDAIGIGRKGTIDKPQYLKAPFWTVDTLFFLTKKNNDNLFFLYNLVQNINWKKYDESTGVPSLSKNNMERVEIHMPNLAEQQAIATFFRSLDRKIALETARLEKLKQIKQACLDKMFV